jgi:hypothetical protein
MTTPDLVRLALGAVLIGAGAWQYRRRAGDPNGGYGSQSAVLLLAVGALLIVWVVGGWWAQPTAAELAR